MFKKKPHEEKGEKDKKKELPQEPQASAQEDAQGTEAPDSGEEKNDQIQKIEIELEKLKVMLEATRDTKKATDETIQTLFENVGEIRSLLFQSDATMKETASKLEKIEDAVAEVKPQEIVKKFRETNSTLERNQIEFEKMERKTGDLSEKINQTFNMLRAIGNIENLTNVNKEVQKKLDDIKEATKYIERLASKTEKAFIELSRGMEDLVLYKSKLDSHDDSIRDLIKSLDAVNVKFDGYVSKKDMEGIREDVVLIQKQIAEINKVLPVAQINMPENIAALKKQKNDILMFLSSLEDQAKAKKISVGEYEDIKKKNMDRINELDAKLRDEWEKIQPLTEKKEKPQTVSGEQQLRAPDQQTAQPQPLLQEQAQPQQPAQPAQVTEAKEVKHRRRRDTADANTPQPEQEEAEPEEKKRRRKRKKVDPNNPAGDFRAESIESTAK
jgi:hypothetical protein